MTPASQLSDYSVTIYKVVGEGTPWIYEIYSLGDLIRTGRAETWSEVVHLAWLALSALCPSVLFY